MTWYIIRTNPNCERRAEKSIGEAGFSTYLPLLRKASIHHRSKRLITRDFPLLTGYLFVQMEEPAPFGFVRGCDGVKMFLNGSNGPLPVPVSVMDAVQHIEGSAWLEYDTAFRQPKKAPKHFNRGKQRVHITEGPFSGFIGHVTETKERKFVDVVTNFFGKLRETSVSVDEIAQAA